MRAPDGRWCLVALLTLGCLADLVIARAQTAQPLRSPSLSTGVGHREEIVSLAYSADGLLLLSGSYDGTAKLWDTRTGVILRSFEHGGPVNGVALSPDGTMAATAGFDGRAVLWNVTTPDPVHQLAVGGGIVNAVVFLPDGQSVVIGGDNGAQMWSVATGQAIGPRLSSDTVKSLALASDSGLIALGTAGGAITLVDPSGRNAPAALRGHDAWVWSVQFSSDGRQLLSGGNDGTVRVWDVATRAPVRSMRARANVWVARFSVDGRYIAAGTESGGPEVWDATGAPVRDFKSPKPVHGLAFHPVNGTLAAGSDDRSLRVLNADTGGLERLLASEPILAGLLVASRDRRHLYISNEDGTARVFDLRTGAVIMSLDGRAASPQSAAFSHDGETLVAVGRDSRTAQVGSTYHRDIRKTISVFGSPLRACDISSDGNSIVTGDEAGAVRIWDVKSRRMIRELTGHTGPVNAVRWIEGTRSVFSGADDHTARLWNVDTGNEERRLQHAGEVRFVAASANASDLLTVVKWDGDVIDGTTQWNAAGVKIRSFDGNGPVAFASDGRTMWTSIGDEAMRRDVATGAVLATFEHGRAIETLAASRDGRSLAITDVDRTAHVFDVALKTRRSPAAQGVLSVQWTWDNRHLVMTASERVTIAEAASGRVVKTFAPIFALGGLAVADNGIVTAVAPGAVPRLWSVAGAAEQRVFQLRESDFEGIALSASGRRMVSHGFGPLAFVWDIESGREVQTLDHGDDGVQSVAIRPDGSQAATGDGEHLRVWAAGQGTVLWTASNPECRASVVDWSPDGSKILTAAHDAVCVWDAASRTRLFRVSYDRPVSHARFSADSGAILLNAGLAKRIIDNDSTPAKLLDASTGQTLAELASDKTGVYAGTALSGSIAVIANHDATMSVIDWSASRELARLVYLSGRTWATISPTGHFDTNDIEGLRGLNWVFPDDPLRPLPPETFVRQFFEPRLLGRLLAGERLDPLTEPLGALQRLSPDVSIEAVDWSRAADGLARVTVLVGRATESRILDGRTMTTTAEPYDIRLFRDGQLVGVRPEQEAPASGSDPAVALEEWRRAKRVVLRADGTERLYFDVRVPGRASGRSIEFSAYAFNSSQVKSPTVTRTEVVPATVPVPRRKAYVITVGVNRTAATPHWDLKYAANDARSLNAAIAARVPGGVFELVQIRLISDTQMDGDIHGPATRAALRTVLDRLAGRAVSADAPAIRDLAKVSRAGPDDFVLLAIASHGYADTRGGFHFVLADTNQPATADRDAIDAATLSTDQLSAWLRPIDAGELVLIVDACQSAAAIRANGFKPGPMGSRGLGQLAYDKGMRVLAASQDTESAFERDATRSGVLTHALARIGLADGRADFRPKNGTIELGEWLAFAAEEVPRLFTRGDQRGGVLNSRGTRDGFFGRRRTPSAYQTPALFDFARGSSVTFNLEGGKMP